MATYVNDLRLKEIATGDEAGTWGTSTNTNLELIGEALGFGTQDCFSSDADATTTVADGSTDPARAMYFKVTSSATLSATRTLTIAPNTVSRVMFIENATTGSQSITISQGSGASVTITTGKTKVVYLDGAGSGAAVVDAMAGVDPGVTDTLAEVLAAGNTTGGTNIVFGDSSGASDDRLVFGAGSDLQLYHDGSNSYVKDSGTGDLMLQGVNVRIQGATTGNNMFVGVDNGASTLYHQNNAKLATTSTGIDVTGGIAATSDSTFTAASGDIFVTASTSAGSNRSGFRVDETSNNGFEMAHDNADNAFFISRRSGSSTVVDALKIDRNTGDFSLFEDTGTTAKFFFDASAESLGIGTSSPATTLTVEGSSANGIELNRNGADATSSARLFFDSSTNCSSIFNSGGNLILATGATPGSASGTERLRLTSDGNIGIGTSSPSSELHVKSTDGEVALNLEATTARLKVNGNNFISATSSVTTFGVNGTERARFDSSGNLLVNGTNATGKLVVDGDANAYTARFNSSTTTGQAFGARVRAGTNSSDFAVLVENTSATTMFAVRGDGNCGVGTSSPEETLSVMGDFQVALNTSVTGRGLKVSTSNGSITDDTVAINAQASTGVLAFQTNSSERLRIDASGLIKIGNAGSSSSPTIQSLIDPNTGIFFGGADILGFSTGGSERARFDASGNFLVGTTTSAPQNFSSGSGTQISDGFIAAARGGAVALLNRVSTDGDIADFRKDGTTIGSIGVINSDNLRIGGSVADHAGLQFALHEIVPMEANVDSNGTISLGSTNSEFKDLYLSGDVFATNIKGQNDTNTKIEFLGSDVTRFVQGGSEKARIDASGNFLVGTTNTTPGAGNTTAGVSLFNDGRIFASKASNVTLSLNRNTSNGDILEFRRDGTAVGSISATDAGYIAIGAGAIYLGFYTDGSDNKQIIPMSTGVGGAAAGTIDLGMDNANHKFKDLYLSGSAFLGTTRAGAGSASAPSHSFFADFDTGMFRATTNELGFSTGGSEKARIDANGDVFIGKTGPGFGTVGTEIQGTGRVRMVRDGGTVLELNRKTSDGAVAAFYKDASLVGSVSVSSSATTYNTSSDQRLKENIVDAPSASDDIDAIQVRSFDWKADGSHQKYGMVAQEIQSVAPEAVTGDADSDEMMGVDYSKLVPMMMKEIQSLRARVAQLEGEN